MGKGSLKGLSSGFSNDKQDGEAEPRVLRERRNPTRIYDLALRLIRRLFFLGAYIPRRACEANTQKFHQFYIRHYLSRFVCWGLASESFVF